MIRSVEALDAALPSIAGAIWSEQMNMQLKPPALAAS
jgi:hypothetical protein